MRTLVSLARIAEPEEELIEGEEGGEGESSEVAVEE
jgi:hypothetical protein